MEYQCHEIYSNSILQPYGHEALHDNVYIRHPDGTETIIGSHLGTAEKNRMVKDAINTWTTNNPKVNEC